MRFILVSVFALAIAASAQSLPSQPATEKSPDGATPAARHTVTIPSGTTIPVKLTHAISTKSARSGDKVYAETSFPLVRDEQVLIPSGTYVQGEVSRVQRPGRVKGRAEVLIHFTTLIYPSGYTVMLPGSIQQIPGAEQQQVKDDEGTLQQEGQKGKDVATVAKTAGTGALIGAVAGGGKGLGLGAASGGVAGLAIALLSRGSDLRLESGSTVEMVFQRSITLDRDRLAKR
jgi:type IV secretion system protein VirB10